MIQVKTIIRRENIWWKQLVSTKYIPFEEYENEVNEYLKTVKPISVIPTLKNGHIIQYTVVYDDGDRVA